MIDNLSFSVHAMGSNCLRNLAQNEIPEDGTLEIAEDMGLTNVSIMKMEQWWDHR